MTRQRVCRTYTQAAGRSFMMSQDLSRLGAC